MNACARRDLVRTMTRMHHNDVPSLKRELARYNLGHFGHSLRDREWAVEMERCARLGRPAPIPASKEELLSPEERARLERRLMRTITGFMGARVGLLVDEFRIHGLDARWARRYSRAFRQGRWARSHVIIPHFRQDTKGVDRT